MGRIASAQADAEAAAARANAHARTLPPSVRCAYEAHEHGWRPDGYFRKEPGAHPPKWPKGRDRWVPAIWWVPQIRKAAAPRESPPPVPRGTVPVGLEALNKALDKKTAQRRG